MVYLLKMVIFYSSVKLLEATVTSAISHSKPNVTRRATVCSATRGIPPPSQGACREPEILARGEPEIQKSVRRTMIHAPESKWLSLLSQLFFVTSSLHDNFELSHKHGLPVSYEPALYWMVSLPIWLIDMYKYKDSMILRTTIQRLHHQPSNFGCSWELPLCYVIQWKMVDLGIQDVIRSKLPI